MPPLMNLPGYEYPRNALVDFSPVNQAIDSNRQNALMQRRADIDQQRLGMERERLGMAKAESAEQKQLRQVQRWGMQAQVIDEMPDGQQKQQLAGQFYQSNPDLMAHIKSKGIDPAHPQVWKLLRAEAGNYDPLKQRLTEAQIAAQNANAASSRAHAGYYSAGTRAMNAKTDAAAQPAPATQSQPLADAYGMTEDGQIIPPSQQQAQPRGFSLPQGGNVPSLPPPASASGVVIQGQQPQQRPPGMMRLGGPRDDIDASMRLDEGRRFGPPQGVQLAQAGASMAPDGLRKLVERYRGQTFGPPGMQSPEVPGVVTTPKGVTDVPATREAAGQRAYEGATLDQQDRYRKFRQEQQLWTSAFGSPPRAGYYYGPRGEELAKSDRVYKGDAENAGLMKHNMQVIDEASKILLNTSLPVQAVAGTIGYGETARALSDLEGAATQIAFTLSGKSVSNAERQEFMNRYAPKPMDSNYTINHKVGRMKQFYQALIDAKKSGVDDRAAWDMATKTTQTTPAPNNPAKGLSDDELLKELNK